jgi:predicted tellurium resistance membrane protein TerC
MLAMKLFGTHAKKMAAFYQRHPQVVFTGLSILILVVFVLTVKNSITLDSWINVAVLAIIPFAMGWAGGVLVS